MTGKAEKISLGDRFPELIKEWDLEKNDGLTAFDFTYGSGKKAWWKCDSGHNFRLSINDRTRRKGCPYCLGRKTTLETCLATKFPEISKQWHPTKNGVLKPTDFRPGSKKRIWWVCSAGHEWNSTIVTRSNGSRCPYCIGNRVSPDRSLGQKFPDIAKQWNYAKNGSITPFDVTFGSGQKVWWICEFGHEWRAKISARTSKTGCPYCSGKLGTKERSLAVRFPYLVKEWNSERNGGLSPFEVSAGCHKKYWWKCAYGHEWKSRPNDRVPEKMCPYCSGKRACKENNVGILFPDLAKEWHKSKNGSSTPFQLTSGSGKKVWWVCENGHEWQAKIVNRVKGAGCPTCYKIKRKSNANSLPHFLEVVQKRYIEADVNKVHDLSR